MKMMSLKEFRRLPKDEICYRLNLMLSQKNHYNPDVMKENGYDFTWVSMKKTAQELGMKEGFFREDENGCVYSVTGVSVQLKPKQDYLRKTVKLDREACEILEALTAESMYSAAILSTVIKVGAKIFSNAKESGRLEIEL